MLRSLVTAALLTLPGVASATDGLEWKWSEGQQRRFVINSQTQTSQLFWIRAQDNIDRRIDEWRLNIVTTCTGVEPLGKKAWSVACTLDDLALAVRPFRGDEAKVDKLLDEYDAKMTGATVRIKWATDGRFQTLDLEGVKHNRSNDRSRQVQETMRLMLIRGFAGLELQLPKKGDDKGKPWSVRDPLVMDFPTLQGTTGGLAVNASIVREKAGKIVVEAGGEGTRGPAVVDQRGKILNMWDIKMIARSTFDTADGSLVKQEVLTEGVVTPSSDLASGTTVSPYVQAINVEQVSLEDEIEALPGNEVITQGPPEPEDG